MSYVLADSATAVRAAAILSAIEKQKCRHYRAKRYTYQQGGMTVQKWGVMAFESVPIHLHRYWSDGFKPCGFVWNPLELVAIGVESWP